MQMICNSYMQKHMPQYDKVLLRAKLIKLTECHDVLSQFL